MGKDSSIQWTDHTFNPWRGCTKVSPGCKHCYADELSRRNPAMLGSWGPEGTRVVASESMWAQPLKWHPKLGASGDRPRVFCASLSDIFEDWPGKMVGSNGRAIYKGALGGWIRPKEDRVPSKSSLLRMDDVRHRLFGLVAATPRLDWLILTKRPERMARYFASQRARMAASEEFHDLVYGRDAGVSLGDGLSSWPPRNLWAGTSVENQEEADRRIPELLKVPATVLFLSMEPLLGPVDLRLEEWQQDSPDESPYCQLTTAGQGLNWVIVGGESGTKARPFYLQWARDIRDRSNAENIPFFMKQLGSNAYDPGLGAFDLTNEVWRVPSKDSHGGDWDEWPEDLRVREFPRASNP